MRTTILATVLLATVTLAGCHAPEDLDAADGYTLVFTTKDDFTDPGADPERLAAWIAARTGQPTQILHVDSEGASIQSLRFAHADAAFMDGGAAWIAWQRFDLDAIAADQKSDGRTYYEAMAWVHADSDITTFEDLRGVSSCHTGRLKSAGMLMPMGYLIGQGIAEVVGDPDDIASLDSTVEAFFTDPHVPEKGDPYYNYNGAFKCLSEGKGDVAFVKDTTWDDYCATDAPDWCLDRDDYRTLPAFGRVPSHPVMVSPDLSDADRSALRDALLALNDDDEGRDILATVLNTPGITAVTTEAHLGSYSENIRHIPGLEAHYAADHDIGS